MAVPEHIREVPRPKNTVVMENKKASGPKRYCVRAKCMRMGKDGKMHRVNGNVIGYITGGRYVEASKEHTGLCGPDYKSYGACAFAMKFIEDIQQDLEAVFPIDEVYKILSAAILRIIRPGRPAVSYKSLYQSCFVSEYFKGAALSKNTIGQLQTALGMDFTRRQQFFALRVGRLQESHHIAIDGTLKKNESVINDLSSYSHKARLRGYKDISVIYAYDIELREPLCAEVFPGNHNDTSAFADFVARNNLEKGIIVADKAFTPEKIRAQCRSCPDLHYILPLRRNNAKIEQYRLLEFDGVEKSVEDGILYKKVKVSDNLFLYSFLDPHRHNKEFYTYIKGLKNNPSQLSSYEHKKDLFGVIVFQSDLDLEPKTVCLNYVDRWVIGLLYDHYKNDLCLDDTKVHSNYAVEGSEFINFIATLISARMLSCAEQAGVLDKMTWGELIDKLNSAWRFIGSRELPARDDADWKDVNNNVLDIMQRLGLCREAQFTNPDGVAPLKRGRKPRNTEHKQEADSKAGSDMDMPRRPRGRPRIHPLPDPNAPKRPRGRPAKPKTEPPQPKRRPGRPRTRPLPDPNAPKRPRGRPRKKPLPQAVSI